MSSLWTDLLFLHGHIADARLARRLVLSERSTPPPTVTPLAKPSLRWLRRLCLGIGHELLRRQ